MLFRSDASGVTLQGVSYPLFDSEVSEGFPIGVSNFITDEKAHIIVNKGCLMIICSPMGEYH